MLSFPSFFSPSRAKSAKGINLKSVEIHHVETDRSKVARTLKHLLKLNHAEHAILFNERRFHNHLPHITGSAYLLGATSDQLEAIYAHEHDYLEPWRDSPGEISEHDWRDYLGKREYERAWIDFFEDQLVELGYDWKQLVDKYLYEGPEPLFNNIVCGLTHPLIHLGYAFELQSRDVAIEALGLLVTNYNPLHKYLNESSYSKPLAKATTSPLEILQRVHEDPRFDSAPHGPDLVGLIDAFEGPILEYWNMWSIEEPEAQFRDSQRAAAAMTAATQTPDHNKFDFFVVHTLTSSHATRICLPFVPAERHVPLVRQWWLVSLLIYIAQGRPKIRMETIEQYDLKGRDWKSVGEQALTGEWRFDAHYVKPIRALKEAALTWGDPDQFYLKAAVKLAENFDGEWGH